MTARRGGAASGGDTPGTGKRELLADLRKMLTAPGWSSGWLGKLGQSTDDSYGHLYTVQARACRAVGV